MPKPKDITGIRFGRFVAIKRVGTRLGLCPLRTESA
jgi:hypothetical protein